jgi:hypothetical protein
MQAHRGPVPPIQRLQTNNLRATHYQVFVIAQLYARCSWLVAADALDDGNLYVGVVAMGSDSQASKQG